jgi:hypothetical protein
MQGLYTRFAYIRPYMQASYIGLYRGFIYEAYIR